jgi:hypothetical protein
MKGNIFRYTLKDSYSNSYYQDVDSAYTDYKEASPEFQVSENLVNNSLEKLIYSFQITHTKGFKVRTANYHDLTNTEDQNYEEGSQNDWISIRSDGGLFRIKQHEFQLNYTPLETPVSVVNGETIKTDLVIHGTTNQDDRSWTSSQNKLLLSLDSILL